MKKAAGSNQGFVGREAVHLFEPLWKPLHQSSMQGLRCSPPVHSKQINIFMDGNKWLSMVHHGAIGLDFPSHLFPELEATAATYQASHALSSLWTSCVIGLCNSNPDATRDEVQHWDTFAGGSVVKLRLCASVTGCGISDRRFNNASVYFLSTWLLFRHPRNTLVVSGLVSHLDLKNGFLNWNGRLADFLSLLVNHSSLPYCRR